MNRPDNMSAYSALDLKLGIKSSLPHVKSAVALILLFWECSIKSAELQYSVQSGDKIVINPNLKTAIKNKLAQICKQDGINIDTVIDAINNNSLFKSQMESLIVAFELIWKLAKISFIDEDKTAGAERTGGIRYPKKLIYTVNADIIDTLIDNDWDAYVRILILWIGVDINYDKQIETRLSRLLTAISEGAIFKLVDGTNDVIFNQNDVYKKLMQTKNNVDLNGDEEAKGSLRILKSLLSDGLNPYLEGHNGDVQILKGQFNNLEEYQKRVETFLQLSATKIIGFKDANIDKETDRQDSLENNRVVSGRNILLYGVPGSGKSWTIEHEYCKPGSVVERLVFHPDYTYSDFIGQILPAVSDDGQVSYKFTPGPFTNILRESYNNPSKEYILIIEEINRGNAPAIFGEVFQLLDRKVEIRDIDDNGYPIGTSEYGITNMNIAEEMYGKDRKTEKVRIPSNLSIIGTMNTSDQNVFTLDTAFQRRWDMRLIENDFASVDSSLADAEILDTGITWKNFCVEINKIVVGNSTRMTSAEDKRLGAYFVHVHDLKYDDTMGDLKEYDALRVKETSGSLTDDEKSRIAVIRDAMRQNRKFPEKVIKYLWDDAFKFNREIIFDVDKYQSLEQVIHAFMYANGTERFKVFKDNVRDAFANVEED
ncbi:McrB family protein [Gardnerella swidsinskii]|jgi:GTPase subunit of restriction endonuclease|uniref:ATPase n=1 Tax=Gardnerella swidsinskii TaxID=2792979 RepID=A0ABM6GIV0_9BIFI|nr:AAA family ATPase [Gardnerella swidsinskii]APW18580.1 ATPase [Gardnerella vaginalis]UQA88489.1 AAA family ATPase [Gardnerella swidsinskii]